MLPFMVRSAIIAVFWVMPFNRIALINYENSMVAESLTFAREERT